MGTRFPSSPATAKTKPGLHEDQIRRIQGRVGKLRALEERKRTVLRSIQSQGQLTDGLAEQIRAANSSKRLEDLYLPFKPKKLTLATVARQKGLEPLATRVLNADPLVPNLEEPARQLIAPDRGLTSPDDVLAGVRHIIAEWFSECADVRGKLRNILYRSGRLICNRIDTATTRDTASASCPSDPAAADLPGDQSVEQPVEASGIDESVVGGEGERMRRWTRTCAWKRGSAPRTCRSSIPMILRLPRVTRTPPRRQLTTTRLVRMPWNR